MLEELKNARGRLARRPRARYEVIGERTMLMPRRGRRTRLHLGCGDRWLRGYLNIDLPPREGVASGTSRPDVATDILLLDCLPGTIAEIRSHHVFEHFERAQALALLVRWYEWLDRDGKVVIETPDFDSCVAGYADRSPAERALILRHVFGSQEAGWARHLDGWSRDRFAHVLQELGYRDLSFEATASDEAGLLANVVATAHRGSMPLADRRQAAHRLLRLSMNGVNPTEERLLGRWIGRFEETLGPVAAS